MKVICKELRMAPELIEVGKETIKGLKKDKDYNKPVKIRHDLILILKKSTEYGDDMYNGTIKTYFADNQIKTFEKFYIVKKTLFGYKTITYEEAKTILDRIDEKKPISWQK